MPKRISPTGSELFIVDNSDEDWKALRYLHDWCQISKSIDIATGYFEIGSLLALQDEWQKVDKIRILMGDEVSRRTRNAFVEGLKQVQVRLDNSLETEKDKNPFLKGVSAIVDAIRSGKIICKVYRKDKFHAKAYITHARMEVVGSSALVGSSNFTYPGLTENIELNVQITGRPVNVLQEWYEEHWEQAENVTPEILRTIERHTREYSPFEIYAKALQEFFRGHEMTVEEWEENVSRMYPVLDRYQKDGYQAMLKIARRHGGAFLCDGVGLGKTFIGLMLIERLILRDRKRVLLLAPKTAREDVWNRDLQRYLSHIGSRDFSNLVVMNHTDIGRGGEFLERFERIKEMADAIIIDEAHHFRNPGIKGTGEKRPSRYHLLHDLVAGSQGTKQIYMLTATPINNGLHDFRHMAELFAREDNCFATIGVHSLRGHFKSMEKHLMKLLGGDSEAGADANMAEAERVLCSDELFRHLVVQRSRSYVKKSQLQHGDSITAFPERSEPKVAEYSVKRTYGNLLDTVEIAFNKEKPLFSLAIYYPLAYTKEKDKPIDKWIENRQKQVVRLIRLQFLKRFESSATAFECSCDRLLLKFLSWVERHSETPAEKNRLERWKRINANTIGYVSKYQFEMFGDVNEWDEEEDLITEEMLEAVECLPRDQYNVDEILDETFLDLDQVVRFVEELRQFDAKHDDKLKALIKLLKNDSVLKKHKVLIFTEYADTARYLKSQLIKEGLEGVEQIDSSTKKNRADVIQQFSPYYNGSSSGELIKAGKDEIRVLISTDVLSEGLNLQDATRLINYDIHWNPVRLMQRIGRVDRRMNPENETKILKDHPDQKSLRGKVIYWNFIPPDELEELLKLYTRVSHKTLRISKTFGVEGRKLLKPADDYDSLREFNEAYEGTSTPLESMHLVLQKLLKDNPDLEEKLALLPGQVFSGKKHPNADKQGVFFCYALPAPDVADKVATTEGEKWSEDAGYARWYLYDLVTDVIIEEPTEIINLIRSKPDTSRQHKIADQTLEEIRTKIEKHIKNTYLKQVQAPIGVRPILKCWMELS